MKKQLLLALVMALTLGITACKNTDSTSNNITNNEVFESATASFSTENSVAETAATMNSDDFITADALPTAESMTLAVVKNAKTEVLSFKSVTNMREPGADESTSDIIGWLLITNNSAEDFDVGGKWMKADGELLSTHLWEKSVRIPAGRTGWLPVYGEVSDKNGAYWVDLIFNEIDYIDKADEVSAEVVTAEGLGYPAFKLINNSTEMVSFQYLILLYKDGQVVDAVITAGGKTIGSGGTVIHYPTDWDDASFNGYADFDQAELYFTAVAYK